MTRNKTRLILFVLLATASMIPAALAATIREEFDDYTGIATYQNATVTGGYIAPVTLYNESNLNGTIYGVGYTMINEGDQVYLWDENYNSNATAINGNLTIAPGADFYTYEFYLDNDQEEENSLMLYDDEGDGFWSPYAGGGGAYSFTVSNDTTLQVKGTTNLNVTVGAGANLYGGTFYTYGTDQDWSAYDFYCIYLYGRNSGDDFNLEIWDNDAPNTGIKFTTPDNYNGYKRHVFAFNDPAATLGGGSFDLTVIRNLYIWQVPTSTGNYYVDRLVLDVGQWSLIEIANPDTMAAPSHNMVWESWTGAAYDTWFVRMDVETPDGGTNLRRLHYLNGQTQEDITGVQYNTGIELYPKGERLENITKVKGDGGADAPTTIVYSDNYGAQYRAGFAVLMPPDDGQDASNAGISQTLIKLTEYYAGTPDGLTTYEHETGNFYSVNVLENLDSTLATNLDYETLIQTGASIEIQFSQENATWMDHNGIADAWDTLENGTGTINLSGLNWAGNLYYRVNMTTGSTPRLLYWVQGYNVDQSVMIAGSITLWIFVVLSLITFIGMVVSSSLVISVTSGALSFICWGVTALVYLYDNATGFTEPALLFGLFAAICGIYAVYAGMKMLNPYYREEHEI